MKLLTTKKKMISFISKNFLGNQTTFLIRKTTKQNKKSTKRIGEAKAFVEDESLSVVYESWELEKRRKKRNRNLEKPKARINDETHEIQRNLGLSALGERWEDWAEAWIRGVGWRRGLAAWGLGRLGTSTEWVSNGSVMLRPVAMSWEFRGSWEWEREWVTVG